MGSVADFTVRDRVALVTGASRGIGAAVASELARAGADVAVSARSTSSLTETCARLRDLGRQVLPIALDVTSLANIQQAIARVEHDLGPIDILVNNAGVNIPQPAVAVTEEAWDTVIDTNLKGAFLCAREVAAAMIARHAGTVINIASAAGLIPALERAPYCASKAGLVMLTRALALEWAPYGVRVNAVAPTFVETELAAQTLNRPGMREYWTARIPLGRLATAEDVAAAVCYLASPAANFLTGVVIPVDGGLTMR